MAKQRGEGSGTASVVEQSERVTMGRLTPEQLEKAPKALQKAWAKAEDWTARARKNGTIAADESYVPLDAIVLDADLFLRKGLSDELVELYGDYVDDVPAISVQKDTLVEFDGRHRIAGASKAARDVVLVREVDIPDDDLYMAAIKENTKHGLPLTSAERFEAATQLLKLYPGKTKKEAAADVGLSRTTLWRWEKGEPEPEGDGGSERVKAADWLPKLEKLLEPVSPELALEVAEGDILQRVMRVRAIVTRLNQYAEALTQRKQ